MEFLMIFFLATFAVAGAGHCEVGKSCVEALVEALRQGDRTDEEICRLMNTTIPCLKAETSKCEDVPTFIQERIAHMEETYQETCEAGNDEDSQMAECFAANENYIHECIYEGSKKALSAIQEQERNFSESELKCAMYSLMAECFVQRIGEKCGEEAAKLSERELHELPEEIEEACLNAGGIDFHNIELIVRK